jgi:uridine kinase
MYGIGTDHRNLRRLWIRKTTIVRKIAEIVPDFVFIPQDSYYRSAEYMSNANITAFNFDHPDAFDTDLLVQHLQALKQESRS